ncbi:MAG: hypothetical protein EXR99_01825 [Gemmataceae bacterium]|nr:hypothetical protein [Gemmataceae bacterium]
MKRTIALFLTASLLVPLLAWSQDPGEQVELQFVDGLRIRGDIDLALEYLKILEKTGSPAFKKDIPLELAKTQLVKAALEKDLRRRQALYQNVLGDLNRFLSANPGSPRAPEASFEIASLSLQMAKTKMSEAQAQRKVDDKVARALEARKLIGDARVQMQKALAAMKTKQGQLVATTPIEKAELKFLSDKITRGEMDLALTFYDEAKTFIDTGKDKDRIDRGLKILEASKQMEKLSDLGETNPQTWRARAWIALFHMENGEPKKARPVLGEIIAKGAASKAAADARRLAKYFLIQVKKDSPEPAEAKNIELVVRQDCDAWLSEFKSYLKTPEAYGVRMLLAKSYINLYGSKSATPVTKADYLAKARVQLREVEQADNEFTEEAKAIKLNLMKEQGAFSKKVADLKSFEDCFTRAQFEIIQLQEAENKETNPEKLEQKRKGHTADLLQALKKALETKEAVDTMKKGSGDIHFTVNNARSMLTFFYLHEKKLAEAIQTGKQFVQDEPRSPQAEQASIYTLSALVQKSAEMEKSRAPEENIAKVRAEMAQFAKIMVDRWPSDTPGDTARHQLGLTLARDKKIPEALALFEKVNPSYPGYGFCMFELGNNAMIEEQNKKDGSYKAKAIKAFEAISLPPPGAEPAMSKVYFSAKARLGGEYYAAKKYQELQNLAVALDEQLPNYQFDLDQTKDDEVRALLKNNINSLGLFALYGLANGSYNKGNYIGAAKTLDPLVDKASKGNLPEIKQNIQLGSALFGMALQANIHAGALENARKVVKALQYLSSDEESGGNANTLLLQLNALIRDQINEVRNKKDKQGEEAAIKGFTAILDDVTSKQKKLPNDLVRLVAMNYSSMKLHDKSLKLLKEAEKPKEDGDAKAQGAFKGIQLQMVREMRALQKFTDATTALDEIIGTKAKPGWGMRDIDSLMERIFLLEDEKKFGASSSQASLIVKQLVSKTGDNHIKEKYFLAYFHMVLGIYRYAQAQTDGAKKTKGIQEAAGLLGKLDGSWPDFGSVDSKKRVEGFLAVEIDLKTAFEAAKGKRPAAIN